MDSGRVAPHHIGVDDDRLLSILRERFGLAEFRGTQRRVVEHLLGGGDAVVVWPTGSGKSLVYQLPALLPERGPVVVLSPLIALMQDQVEALRARGIAATFINSSLERAERERRAADFARGKYRLLYVTPERFRNESFVAAVTGGAPKVGLLAVDEAHCISTWGHDFRPEYGRVGRIRELLGRPPTVALTATATPAVVDEIRTKLGIPEALVDHAGIARPNLFLAATIAHDEAEKWERVASLLERLPGSGIVYGQLIRDLHRLEDFLRVRTARTAAAGDAMAAGGAAARGELLVYHGDLSREERRSMHARFQDTHADAPADGIVRVLATRAFGMGIDKPDLRFIVHHQVPGSVEELWQEVGRAGRDGLPSWCELVYCEQDLPIPMQFVRAANPDRRLFREVVQRLGEWTARGESFDLEKLRHAVTGRSAADGRVETVLSWLETLGAVEGEIERGKLRLVRPLAPEDEPEELGPEKEKRDLERLAKVVEYVRTEKCRRRFLHDYFGLEPPVAENCGACDRCVDREAWLEEHFARVDAGAAKPRESGAPAADRAPQRGDYVRVDGRLLGRVVRVSGKGRDARVEVELTTSLDTRTFSARRHRIEVLRSE
jgi:ATP-dependent DNA helicase RecQ